jgi:hypothetical protein
MAEVIALGVGTIVAMPMVVADVGQGIHMAGPVTWRSGSGLA